MLRRFVLAVLALLLYLAAWMAPLYLIVQTLADENDIALAAIGVMIVAGLLQLPFMDWIAKHVFYLKGEGKPAPESSLRARLMDINRFDIPVVATEAGSNIEISWKVLDPKWREQMIRHGVQRTIKLTVRFDAAHRRVTLIDTVATVIWGSGLAIGERDTFRWSWFRGVYLGFQRLQPFENLHDAFAAATDRRFSTSQLHDPVISLILRSGWDVRFGMF